MSGWVVVLALLFQALWPVYEYYYNYYYYLGLVYNYSIHDQNYAHEYFNA